jgi:hypothetical protein
VDAEELLKKDLKKEELLEVTPVVLLEDTPEVILVE